jgi:hypothetical protein
VRRVLQSTVTLKTGVKIPKLGFETALISDDEGATIDVILKAIEAECCNCAHSLITLSSR